MLTPAQREVRYRLVVRRMSFISTVGVSFSLVVWAISFAYGSDNVWSQLETDRPLFYYPVMRVAALACYLWTMKVFRESPDPTVTRRIIPMWSCSLLGLGFLALFFMETVAYDSSTFLNRVDILLFAGSTIGLTMAQSIYWRIPQPMEPARDAQDANAAAHATPVVPYGMSDEEGMMVAVLAADGTASIRADAYPTQGQAGAIGVYRPPTSNTEHNANAPPTYTPVDHVKYETHGFRPASPQGTHAASEELSAVSEGDTLPPLTPPMTPPPHVWSPEPPRNGHAEESNNNNNNNNNNNHEGEEEEERQHSSGNHLSVAPVPPLYAEREGNGMSTAPPSYRE